jgi:WD40 repeat protein
MRLGTLKREAKNRPRPTDRQAVTFLAGSKTLGTFGRHREEPLVRFWAPATGKLQDTFTPRGLEGRWRWSWVTLSPDEKTVAALGYDEAADPDHRHGSHVWLWSRGTGKALHKLWMPADLNTQVAFSPDGRLVAAGETDGRVRVWAVADGKKVADVDIWPRQDGVKVKMRCYQAFHPSFSPDSNTLAVQGGAGTIHLCDPRTGKQLRSWAVHGPVGHGGQVLSVAFSPDWKRLACGLDSGLIGWWDVETGKLLRWSKLPGRWRNARAGVTRPYVEAVAFSLDGKLLASGDTDHAVCLWDAGTGKEVARFGGHEGSVYSVAFSPDGSTLASLSQDSKGLIRTALIWKVPRAGH